MARALLMSARGPMSLTSGMRNAADVTEQKDASNSKLDENVKHASATLESLLEVQVKHQRDYLYVQADKQKKQIDEQVEMEVKQQEMALKKQYADHTMALKQKAAQEKAA